MVSKRQLDVKRLSLDLVLLEKLIIKINNKVKLHIYRMAYQETFAQLQKKTPEESLEALINGYTETTMSTYVYSLLKNHLKCRDINNNMWFFKDKHNEWSWDKDNRQFRIALHDVVQADLKKNIHINTASMQTISLCDLDYERMKCKISRMADIAAGLHKEKFKNETIKFCRDIFYEED